VNRVRQYLAGCREGIDILSTRAFWVDVFWAYWSPEAVAARIVARLEDMRRP
jgi:hypothetical protein